MPGDSPGNGIRPRGLAWGEIPDSTHRTSHDEQVLPARPRHRPVWIQSNGSRDARANDDHVVVSMHLHSPPDPNDWKGTRNGSKRNTCFSPPAYAGPEITDSDLRGRHASGAW